MKIEIDRKELNGVLSSISRVVTPPVIEPLFECVFVKTVDDKISLTVTDTIMWVETKINANVIESGQESIPIKMLASFVSKANSDKVVIESGEKKVVAKCGRSKISIAIDQNDGFADSWKSFDVVNSFKINSKKLCSYFRKTIISASKESIQRNLSGVMIAIDNKKLRFVAVDGRKLSLIEEDMDSENSSDSVVPLKTVSETVSSIASIDDEVEVTIGKKRIQFKVNDLVINSSLVSAEGYPPYMNIIPSDSNIESTLVLNTKDFVKIIETSCVAITNKSIYSLCIEITNNSLKASSQGNTSAETYDEMDVKYEGEDIKLFFNPDYFKDVLKVIDSKEFDMNLIDSESPIVLKDGNFKYLAMPLKI